MGKRLKTVFITLLACGCLLAVALLAELYYFFPQTTGPGAGEERIIEIPRGIGPRGLAALLHESRVITEPQRFALWIRLSGRIAEIKAGNFMVQDNWSPRKIADTLAGKGIEKGVRVTIPEGFTLGDMAETLERQGIVKANLFLKAATDKNLLSGLGIRAETAEGYLFPDTYYFKANTSAETLVKLMKHTFDTKSTMLNHLDEAQQYRTLILASIVQSEARVADEMPVIAGVYSNRLDQQKFPSGLLQADPAVAYGCSKYLHSSAPSCKRFTGVLKRAQLDDPQNEYNTYRHPGLPPGPICSPGVDALKAAASPADVPYLYFVVSKDGRHTFSRTHEEHSRAVQLYLKTLND